MPAHDVEADVVRDEGRETPGAGRLPRAALLSQAAASSCICSRISVNSRSSLVGK